MMQLTFLFIVLWCIYSSHLQKCYPIERKKAAVYYFACLAHKHTNSKTDSERVQEMQQSRGFFLCSIMR